MAISNGYCTADDLADYMQPAGALDSDSAALERAVESASREIDAHCHRSFWKDTTADTARTFRAESASLVYVDDCFGDSITVKADFGNNGTFGTTLVEGTDYLIEPAGNRGPGAAWRPFTELRALNRAFPCLGPRRRIEVTPAGGTFGWGWTSVPTEVHTATLMIAAHIFRRPKSIDGFVETVDASVRVSRYIDNDAALLLAPFCLDPVLV